MKNLKVVIAAGGDGTRLGLLNSKGQAKSLLLFGDRPLISFQLDILRDNGLKEIHLSFTRDSQKKDFEFFIKKGLVPNLDYSFSFHDHFEHPACLFRADGVKNFISKSDFLFSQGDLIVRNKTIEDLIKLYEENECTVAIKEKARRGDKKKFILMNSFLVDIIDSNKSLWRYGGLYIIKNQDIPDWYAVCESSKMETFRFFERCLERKSKVCFLKGISPVININTPKEFLLAQKYLKEKFNLFVLK